MNKTYSSPYWLTFKISIIFVLLFALNVSAQDSVAWINANAHELKSGSVSDSDDLSYLRKELKGKNIVGLGEASHGTHEFYVQKARIIEYLVRKCNFKLLAFETPESMILPINTYTQSGEGNLKALMKDMGLYRTEEIYNLFQLIREYNKDKSPEDRVEIVGMDKDQMTDPYTRDKSMTENLIKSYARKKSKTIVWAHNVHIAKDTTSNSYALGLYLNQHFKNQFYNIGFDTFKGTVNVMNGPEFEEHTFQANENTFTKLLAQAKYKSFFLPFRKDGPFNGNPVAITNVYSNWQEPPKPFQMKPGIDFDAIIFIKESSASIGLGRQ